MKPQYTKNILRTYSILLLGIMAPPVFFLVIATFLQLQGEFADNKHMEEILMPLTAGIAILGILGNGMVFRMLVAKARPDQNLLQKLQTYQTGFIARLAILEAPALMCGIGYMLTGNAIFIGIALALLFMMVIRRPSLAEIMEKLPLSREEEALLQDPEGRIE
jgi:hypothetical protein